MQQDWSKLKVFPLAERKSLTRVEDILIDPASEPRPAPPGVAACAERIRQAKAKGAAVVLFYGAHLLRNGAALILSQMMERGWITHIATNGAGTIHDWEYAWLGRSTESVEENVATGTFGAWDETGRNIHIALLAGALRGEGYGVSLGRLIAEDGASLPGRAKVMEWLRQAPDDRFAPAWADLLQSGLAGPVRVAHRWKQASILYHAFTHGIPATVHPGIGYDIIANHPLFSGAVIGRAAGIDFRLLGDSVENLDNGVVLSIGSAIMAPQVFEKTLSNVNNLRISAGRPIVQGHSIYVVDLQDGGGWDWTTGEPPKTNPAYYLRFCKSFSRMGGEMQYLQSDNVTFLHNLYHHLTAGHDSSNS